MPEPETKPPERAYRWRLLLFLLSAVLILFLCNTLYRGVNTLSALDRIEAERDGWQRPTEIIQALGLEPNQTVVDLGSGAGYFTLKLSPAVGPGGRVRAVDILRLPSAFLWIRTRLRHQQNVTLIHGEPADPHLPGEIADAVLIVNTYHEFAAPAAMLAHVFRALRPGGRLVIVDREGEAAEHHAPVQAVAMQLQASGFLLGARQDRFLVQPGSDTWWLLAALRPAPIRIPGRGSVWHTTTHAA